MKAKRRADDKNFDTTDEEKFINISSRKTLIS
jgi:hypothetical protein